MEPNTPEKDPRSKLADEILSTGKRAFDPSSDAASRTAAQEEFQKLIDGYVGAVRPHVRRNLLTRD